MRLRCIIISNYSHNLFRIIILVDITTMVSTDNLSLIDL